MNFEQNKNTMTTLCNSAILWLSFLRANTVIKKVERELMFGVGSEKVNVLFNGKFFSFFFPREI